LTIICSSYAYGVYLQLGDRLNGKLIFLNYYLKNEEDILQKPKLVILLSTFHVAVSHLVIVATD